MLPRSPRPRAADDFAAIRARLEELRREREQLVAKSEPRRPLDPRPDAVSGGRAGANRPGIPLAMRRSWMR